MLCSKDFFSVVQIHCDANCAHQYAVFRRSPPLCAFPHIPRSQQDKYSTVERMLFVLTEDPAVGEMASATLIPAVAEWLGASDLLYTHLLPATLRRASSGKAPAEARSRNRAHAHACAHLPCCDPSRASDVLLQWALFAKAEACVCPPTHSHAVAPALKRCFHPLRALSCPMATAGASAPRSKRSRAF